MKQTRWTTAVSLMLLLVMVIPSPAWSAPRGIFINQSTAKRLYADLRFYREDAAAKGRRLKLADADRTLLEQQGKILQEQVAGLTADKDIYRREAEQFKTLYTEADRQRVEAETSRPSRAVWFATGIAATVITFVTLTLTH